MPMIFLKAYRSSQGLEGSCRNSGGGEGGRLNNPHKQKRQLKGQRKRNAKDEADSIGVRGVPVDAVRAAASVRRDNAARLKG